MPFMVVHVRPPRLIALHLYCCHPDPSHPILSLQDPFSDLLEGQHIFDGEFNHSRIIPFIIFLLLFLNVAISHLSLVVNPMTSTCGQLQDAVSSPWVMSRKYFIPRFIFW